MGKGLGGGGRGGEKTENLKERKENLKSGLGLGQPSSAWGTISKAY